MAKQKGESSQGLIVALVFFILLTIALGVTTYLGYSGQDGYEAKIKDEQNKTKAMTASRDWNQWQAMAYREAMGRLTLKDPQDFALRRDAYLKGQIAPADKTEKEEVDAVIRDLEAMGQFDPAKGRYTVTYEGKLAALQKDLKDWEDKAGKEKARADGLDATVKQKDDLIAQLKKDQEATVAKLNEENLKVKADKDVNKDNLMQQIKELTDARVAEQTAAAEEKKKLTAELKKYMDLYNDQKRQLGLVSEELLAIKSKSSDTAPKNLRTDWKIATIQGNQPYINLGSADNVKSQLTFSIHGVGPDGRPIPQPKGTLEVVNVIGPHLSQARITSVVDANRDPVLIGDVLSNSSWDPFQKKRVAIAGYVDLHGDGREMLAELKRVFERQNIQVDAYLDLKDFTIKGAMTLQTDYLILGDGPEVLPYSVRERDGFGKKLAQGIEDMKAEAKKNGVPLIGLNKYLDSIGYKVPRPTSAP